MDHRVFNHSHAEGHLGCFQVLTIVNKAATNIHHQEIDTDIMFTQLLCEQKSFLWDKCLWQIDSE